MTHVPYDDALGFVYALDHNGEKVTAKNLVEAMEAASESDKAIEIDNKAASKCLKRYVRQGLLLKLGGDPVVYKPITNPLTEEHGTTEESE